MQRYIFLFSVILLLVSCNSKAPESNPPVDITDKTSYINKQFSVYLESMIHSVTDSTLLTIRHQQLHTTALIQQFYATRDYYPAWTSSLQRTATASELEELLSGVHYYGLDSSWYHLSELQTAYQLLENEDNPEMKIRLAAEYELLATNSCFLLMSHLQNGKLYPDTTIYTYRHVKFPPSYQLILQKAIKSDHFTKEILALQPQNQAFRNLQKALVQYINTQKLHKEAIYIPDPKTDSAACYQKAQEVLVRQNYLEAELANDTAHFFAALKAFQFQHGISIDGKIGRNTREELSISAYERYRQIVINLERLRWEQQVPEYYVFINIPSFQLSVVDNDSVVTVFKVITGHRRTPTPELTSEIEHFTTYPEWYVPFSISSNEILPKMQDDPEYLQRNRYMIYNKERQLVDATSIDWDSIGRSNFNFKIKQRSGRHNALGTIKFSFPNPYHVYLHDTPGKRLFRNTVRAYSHGCIRLENPVKFGQYLLEYDTNDIAPDSLQALMDSARHQRIKLSEPVPIYIRYLTCSADTNGNITFYKDIYNKDMDLKKKYFESTY